MVDLTQIMDDEVFMAFASYATIVLSKMMLMSVTTAFYRLTRKVFANPEDCVTFGKGENAKKYLRTDDRVERVRRAHLNDLENIVPFLGIGLLYSLSGPDLSTAILHFRLFVGARIYHTISYLTPLPQPNRGLSFFIGYGSFECAFPSAMLCFLLHSHLALPLFNCYFLRDFLRPLFLITFFCHRPSTYYLLSFLGIFHSCNYVSIFFAYLPIGSKLHEGRTTSVGLTITASP
uniref:Microsomal glutathione S-transferase 1 n=1 Tax=Papio anubis TaxID=9555 RepID=A0A8I5MWY6_PAPAN